MQSYNSKIKVLLVTILITKIFVVFGQSSLPNCNSVDLKTRCYYSGPLETSNGVEWTYDGEMINNLIDGYGVVVTSSGQKFEGKFKAGLPTSGVKKTNKDGVVFVGTYQAWTPLKGLFKWPDGESFEGVITANGREGFGIQVFPNGDKYEGYFKNGLYHGHGTFYYLAEGENKGGIFSGQYIKGKMNGPGTFILPGVGKYVGNFKDDSREGFGTIYDANGKIYQRGIFKDGKFFKEQASEDTFNAKPTQSTNPQVENKKSKCLKIGLVPGTDDYIACIK
jgi:hypothetical protein